MQNTEIAWMIGRLAIVAFGVPFATLFHFMVRGPNPCRVATNPPIDFLAWPGELVALFIVVLVSTTSVPLLLFKTWKVVFGIDAAKDGIGLTKSCISPYNPINMIDQMYLQMFMFVTTLQVCEYVCQVRGTMTWYYIFQLLSISLLSGLVMIRLMAMGIIR